LRKRGLQPAKDPAQSNGNSVITFFNGIVNANYSDIDFTFTGTGNIATDPQFIDTLLFILSNQSPCIDSGDPSLLFNDQTASVNLAKFPSKGNERNDLGVYGGPLALLLPDCPILATGLNENNFHPIVFCYPNPFVDHITVDLPDPAHISISTFEGQVILSRGYNAGIQKINFREEQPGLYFIKVISETSQRTLKIIKEN